MRMSLSQSSNKSVASEDRLKKMRKRDIHGDPKSHTNMSRSEEAGCSSSTPDTMLNSDRNTNASGNAYIAYEIINFMTVFGALSRCVQCKVCAGDVQFSTSERDGLAFKIQVKCPKCNPRFIESCPKSSPRTYEINRRIVFTMSTLGIDFSGLQWFCGLMDLPCILTLSSYGRINKFIRQVASGIAQLSMTRATNLDMESSPDTEGEGIAIIGNTSWREGGSKSLHGIVAVIGKCSGKVLDVNVKSSYCAACKTREPPSGTPEYAKWPEEHERACRHEGRPSQMEFDATCEIFGRSEEKYGVRYQSYVSKANAKTFAAVRNSRPYGPDYEIHEEELLNSPTRPNNESFHSDLCRIPTNNASIDIQITEIAVFAAVIIFNDGYFRLLAMMGAFDLKMGRRAYAFFSEPSRVQSTGAQTIA